MLTNTKAGTDIGCDFCDSKISDIVGKLLPTITAATIIADAFDFRQTDSLWSCQVCRLSGATR